MTRSIFMSVALLALAACDKGSTPATPAVDPTAAAATDKLVLARIAALRPGQVDIVLFRAIRDSGKECQGIAASRRLADQNGRPAWSAQCDRGGQYLLVLQANGVMTVTGAVQKK